MCMGQIVGMNMKDNHKTIGAENPLHTLLRQHTSRFRGWLCFGSSRSFVFFSFLYRLETKMLVLLYHHNFAGHVIKLKDK